MNTVSLNHLRFDAVIVDLDGTMIDTLGDFVVALNLMLNDLAMPPVDRARVGRLVGKGSEHLINSVLVPVESEEFAIKNEANDLSQNRQCLAAAARLMNGRFQRREALSGSLAIAPWTGPSYPVHIDFRRRNASGQCPGWYAGSRQGGPL